MRSNAGARGQDPSPRSGSSIWPVYVVVALAAFLTVLLAAVSMLVVLSAGSLLGASAGLSDEALKQLSNRLREEASTGLFGLVAGGGSTFLVLGLLSVVASRSWSWSWRRPVAAERSKHIDWLRADVFSLVDLGLTTLGFLGLGLVIDEVVGTFALDRSGSLSAFNEIVGSVHGVDRALLALFLGLGAGVGEEMFFRGYVLNRIWLARGRAHALLASSLLFGVFHADLVHSTLATIMGFYLGMCFIYSKSLPATVAAHALNNMLVVSLFDVHLHLGPRYDFGAGEGSGLSLWSVVGAATATVCLVALARRHRDEGTTVACAHEVDAIDAGSPRDA
ncbi:MAG: CPBP family intramembrane metalloprotease [Deltaproteobacteria bacterium]|nr:CPBP family intramembrane metalloprotease [Deltaproteobacteria bacterium]